MPETPFSSSRKERGFTLIELVMVIVILGILSAFALPRFADLSSDARLATLEALEGAVRSATGSVHSLAIVQNKTDCLTDPTVEMEGETITLRCGYPCPHPNGIGKAVIAEGAYSWVGGNCAGVQGYVTAVISDAPDPSQCSIKYESAEPNKSPVITSVTGGC